MKDKQPFLVDKRFHEILDQIESHGLNAFITGRAGTGKSTLLSILKKTTKKNAVVLAPTGIAALNVSGQTIHSFFKLPPKLIDPHELTKRKNHYLYKKLQLLIIDEISMVRADLMDCIDIFLRVNRDDPRPFGGVQIVVFGDLFQLPPVVASQFERKLLQDKYGTAYFFGADVFQEVELTMIELRTVYRQQDRGFISLLDRIRTRQLDYEDMEEINQRHLPDADESESLLVPTITLCTTNAIVNQINASKLKELQTDAYTFAGTMSGQFKDSISPAPTFLTIKRDAQVMFVKNDPEGRFVNGTLGRVVHVDTENISVAITKQDQEEKILEVEKVEWEMTRYEIDEAKENKFKSVVIGTYKQYPLKLAWAMTIHKSQGKTFDKVIIDLGRGAFDHGQTYVALSRCRTFEGIILKKKMTPKDILVDNQVIEYYDTMIRR